MNRPDDVTLAALATFAAAHVRSHDIDPVYPILSWLERNQGEEDALERSLIYVAFYNVASAETFRLADDPAMLRLPTGIERRGLRGGAPMSAHLEGLYHLRAEYGSLRAWLLSQGATWNQVREAVELAYGNGRWASYKTVEILAKVHGWPLTAPDMGNYGSSGPRWTLNLLYPDLPPGDSAAAVDAADAAAADLLAALAERDVVLGIEELETVLCDFGSMTKGHFYVGHDIDKMLEQTLHPSVPAAVRELLWMARAEALPTEYLGELRGWSGVDRFLCGHYARTGEVITRPQAWST